MGNEKIDDLFDVNKMKKTIKKAKWRANWKTVLITIIVLFVLTIVGTIANQKITETLDSRAHMSAMAYHEISSPNEFIGKQLHYPGFLGGENRFTKYKIIEGKVVYSGQDEYGYGLFRNHRLSAGWSSPIIIGPTLHEGDLVNQHYNEYGLREMVFFYPFIQYKTYRNDLALLDELGDNKIMEVALSFDKGYTMDEVESMLPKDVSLTWLWVDDVDENKDDFQYRAYNDEGEVIKEENIVRSEQDVYGFSLINENGELRENAVYWFIGAIEGGKQHKGRWQMEFQRLYEILSGEDGELTPEDLQFYGAVVTGDAESLAQLRDLPFIKASSIGVITDKY